MALIQSDKSNAFEFDVGETLTSGLYLSMLDTRIPFWKDVDGVMFDERGVVRRAGREGRHDFASDSIRGIIGVNEYDTKTAYIGDLTSIYSYRLEDQSTDTVGTSYNLIENGGGTTWDAGLGGTPDPTEWDGGTTTWDEGVNVASAWSMIDFGQWVFATNDVDKPQVKKNNVNFNDMFSDGASGISVTTAGSLHIVGETLTAGTYSAGGSAVAITVTEVDSGGITAFEVTNFGTGLIDAETITSMTTSGSGTGAEFSVTVPDAYFTTAKIFAKQGPYVLIYNYETASGSAENKFAWCDADNPDEWVASATNTAGSLRIREANGGFECVAQLGDSHAVYTENQMFLVSYVGLPAIFGYRPALEGDIGAVSVNAVVSVGRVNYGLCSTGFFATDGVTVNKIGEAAGIDKHIKKYAAEYAQVCGYHNADNSEVVWTVPIASNEPTKEFAYNYENNTWSVRTTTLTYITERGVFDNPLSGNTGGEFFFEGNQASDDGDAISVSATTKAFDLGYPDRVKELTSIRVGKRGNGNPVMRIGWSEDIDASPTYVDSFSITETFQEEHLRTAGRWLFIEITSSGSSDDWEISDLKIQGRYEGSR